MDNKTIKIILSKLNLKISDEQISDILVYTNELKIWNKRCDLTSLEITEEIFTNLFVDSFTLIPFVKPSSKLMDVGTGGGFPGLALKIYFPELKVTLLDSSRRKVVFLNHIKTLLKFSNVNVIWGRAEECGRDQKFREQYELVCSRAVAKMNSLVELCLPFVKIGGIFLAPKGKDLKEIENSKKVIELLGGKVEKIERINYPCFKEARHVVLIKKTKEIPSKYPRRSGIPQKRPLK